MDRYLPPLCLFLALVLLVAGFALLAMGGPEAGIELHRARVDGEDEYQEVLERQLKRRQWSHRALVGGLFAAALLSAVAAFWTMRPRRNGGGAS